VIPSWVQTQLRDLAGLLRDVPERVKLEFQRLGLSVVMHPIADEGPTVFYRAIGAAQLPTLSGSVDVRSTTDRSKEQAAGSKPIASGWRSQVDLPANQFGPGWRRRVR
jgi:hypothetical protein